MHDNGTGTYFFNRFSTVWLLLLFGITTVGIVTLVWEKTREARWQRDLNWSPSLGTQTFALRENELSEAIFVGSKCFRYRSHPPGTGITIHARSKRNEPFKAVSQCRDTVEHCRWIKFSINRPGHVFLDTNKPFFWRSRQQLSCDTILAGWPLHQRSAQAQAEQARIQREAEEAAGRRQAERQSLERSFDTHVSKLDRGEQEMVSPARDCVASQSRSALGGALEANGLSRWVHDGAVTYQANQDNVLLEVLHFDVHDQSCQQTLNRLLASGLVNEKIYADSPVEEVATLPRGAPPRQNSRSASTPDNTLSVMRASLERSYTVYEIKVRQGERADVVMRQCRVTKRISGGRWYQAEHRTERRMRYTAPEGDYHLNVLTFDKQLGSCSDTFNLLREVGLISPGQFDGLVLVEWGN